MIWRVIFFPKKKVETSYYQCFQTVYSSSKINRQYDEDENEY